MNDIKLDRILGKITSGVYKKIVVMTGAGISCASGIPDFRSPGGLYATLRPELLTASDAQKDYLAHDPTGVVDIRMFKYNQFPYLEVRRPFILGTQNGQWKPTIAHVFSKVAEERGLLQRTYDQNIDGLHMAAGLDAPKLVHVHGTLSKVNCEFCKATMQYSDFCIEVAAKIKNIYDPADSTAPAESSNIICESCGRAGMKPSTVLYGTDLPRDALSSMSRDFPTDVDLLVIAGTSLTVYPAAGLVSRVRPGVPRILVNLEPAGEDIMRFDDADSDDVFLRGSCDEGFLTLAEKLGWLPDIRRHQALLCDASSAMLNHVYVNAESALV